MAIRVKNRMYLGATTGQFNRVILTLKGNQDCSASASVITRVVMASSVGRSSETQ